ncbi:MAG: hypothetical protein HYZ89_06515 [Candidatus Omnitrophica bacterium]|nr:hypothetical protein [Candidatus Omnitrophota bacterium]
MSRAVKWSVSILAGIGLAAAGVVEWGVRHRLERRYHESLEARRALILEVGELRSAREELASALLTERQQTEQLSAALSAKDAELTTVVARLSKEDRVIQELEDKLLAMQNQLAHAQGELAVALQTKHVPSTAESRNAVQLEKVIVAHSSSEPALQGRVLSINAEWQFVVINLGWDVLDIGEVVSIYHDNKLMAKARVERVQEQASAATLLPEWGQAEIHIDDVVRTL